MTFYDIIRRFRDVRLRNINLLHKMRYIVILSYAVYIMKTRLFKHTKILP